MAQKKHFRKMFFVIFPICLVLFTGAIFGISRLLDAKIAGKSGVVAAQETEDNLDLLIPGEGMFKSEYYNSKRINVLLYGNTDEGLADTIMLCSFDPEEQVVDVISVPRDTYYEREGYNYSSYRKINASALPKKENVTEKNPHPKSDPMGLCRAVHDVLLGIPINYYAMVEYDGVKKIVDSMDGVPMNIPKDMKYTSKKHKLYIDLKKGEQVLDGEHAVQFLRYRKGYVEGDLGRVKAQQQFVKNAAKQALGLDLPKVAVAAVENVDSTITARAVLYLAKKAKGMSFDAVNAHTLPGTDGWIDKLSFWIRADNSEIEKMLREIYDGPAAASTDAGTTTDGTTGDGTTGTTDSSGSTATTGADSTTG